jgi:hypothetical protein
LRLLLNVQAGAQAVCHDLARLEGTLAREVLGRLVAFLRGLVRGQTATPVGTSTDMNWFFIQMTVVF